MHQSIRIKFSKKGALRFISHQDTLRLIERAIRRSGLPVKMSEGFNPKPQISYLLALGVGIESDTEWVTIRLREWTRTRQVIDLLAGQMPEGAEILDAEVAPPKQKPMASQVEYTVRTIEGEPVAQHQIDKLLSQQNVPIDRIRKGKLKTVDIRPYIRQITCKGNSMQMQFDVTPAGTANPLEVLRALGCEDWSIATKMRIVRTQLS